MGSNDLFCQNNARAIEEKIIEFIVSLREKGLSRSAIRNYVFCVISFYKINDVVLNTAKISKFMPKFKKMKQDRAYERHEIHKLLNIADERFRAVILLMASTGMRIGAIPDLKIRNLKKLDNDIYKVTVYEGEKEEYFTFTTPECTNAIDNYIDMRKRYGENITDDSFLIRGQFNVRAPSKKQKQTIANTLFGKLRDLSNRSGVRDKTLPICHGFRKFFTSQLVESDLKTELRWMLEGHNLKGNDSSYVRTTEQRLLQEYMKAVNNLTINEENRLKIKVQLLEGEKNEITTLKKQVNETSSTLNDILDLLKLKVQNDLEIDDNEDQEQVNQITSIDKRLSQKGIKSHKYLVPSCFEIKES